MRSDRGRHALPHMHAVNICKYTLIMLKVKNFMLSVDYYSLIQPHYSSTVSFRWTEFNLMIQQCDIYISRWKSKGLSKVRLLLSNSFIISHFDHTLKESSVEVSDTSKASYQSIVPHSHPQESDYGWYLAGDVCLYKTVTEPWKRPTCGLNIGDLIKPLELSMWWLWYWSQ